MRPLLAAACLCLMTACPSVELPEVSVGTDAHVLQGRWSGTLLDSLGIRELMSGGGQVYVLAGHFEQTRLEVYDAATGTLLATERGTTIQDLAYADGDLLILGTGQLSRRNPRTLAQRLLAPLDGSRLSEDGRLVSQEVGGVLTRRLVATGQAVPTTTTPIFVGDRSSDDAWWLGGGKVVRASDGLSSGAVSAHGDPCNLGQASGNLTPITVERDPLASPNQGYLLGWSDGVIERRAADGTLVSTLNTDACVPITDLYTAGQMVAYATSAGQVGQIDLTGGLNVARYTPGQRASHAQVGPDGAIWRSPQGTDMQPWTAPAWTAPLAARTVTLNVVATRTDSRYARVTGTGTLDGQAVTVSGTLQGWGVILAQSPPPPALSMDVTLWNGSVELGRLSGGGYIFRDVPTYSVSWLPADRLSIYSGDLLRP